MQGIVEDPTPFRRRYEPSHPDADADGFVAMPNVDVPEEMVDMLGAARAYQANITAIGLIRDTIQRLMDAGLQSIPGGGAEILDDEIRGKIARLKCTSDDWIEVHRTSHSLGLRTTATMMFGCGETLQHRVNHLERIRQLQEETGGFTAFIPWIFAAENTALGKKVQETTAVDYLKTLAVSRLYLDNLDHIQSSWLTPGIKVCQVGLQFGADDVGSILIEENVVYAAGVRNRTNEGELRRIISEAGFRPDHVITLQLFMPGTVRRSIAFADDMLARVQAVPGVDSAALTSSLPEPR